MNSSPKAKIEKILNEFTPSFLEVHDDSLKHAGHAGARPNGGSHFSVLIVSDDFEGKTLIERHRLIYQKLKTYMEVQEVHALALRTYTSSEWSQTKLKDQPAVIGY